MATIKSYTSLEQSKKLAKILPHESADMEYLEIKENGALVGAVPFVKDDSEVEDSAYSHTYDRIACWSLAALISIIPQELFNGKYIINITEGCRNRWILTYDDYEDRSHSYYGLSTGADNPVDACVAMIEKLHEQNIL